MRVFAGVSSPLLLLFSFFSLSLSLSPPVESIHLLVSHRSAPRSARSRLLVIAFVVPYVTLDPLCSVVPGLPAYSSADECNL